MIEGQTAEDLDLATSKATQSALNLKADKADTLAGYGITDAYTKEEVEARLSSVYKFKGSVPTYDNLPSENNIIGDVYNVEDTGSNYAWDGEKWDKLSETIDLTPYALKSTTLAGYGITDAYTKEEVDVKIAEKDSLPSQADKQGTFLSTNGTSAFWSALPESNDITKGIVKLASAEELTEGTSESSVITVKQFKDNLNLKQDNLIAGNGIAIENNTISATIEVPDNVIISDNYVNAKLWKGTLEEYDLLESHDDSVTYIITDDYTQVDYNYNTLQNKPQINSVELSGNKSLDDLGIQAKGEYALKSEMELKADKADTLAGYGITDGLSTSQITNCITKIPQDIKLELSEDGTLTLKAGSKVYVPNGAGVFDEVVMETDRTTKGVSFDSECYIIYDKLSNNIYYRALSQVQVFEDVPTEEISGILEIYCSNENAIYTWNSSTNVWDRKERSLPIALSTLQKSEPYIVSLNQVFNGFGYFGNMIFSLPGIECIAPNGRNSDGSLRNTIYLTKMATRVLSMPDIDEDRIMYIGSGDSIGNQLTNVAYLDKEKNLVAEKNKNGTFNRYISGGSVIIGPRFIIGNNKIKIFPKNTLQLIDDYNVVHNTGDEEIAGVKTFKDEITAPNQVDYTQITNCITKIPQDIKLELTDGTLTLKADSKIYFPNGAGVFVERTASSDISRATFGSETNSKVLILVTCGTNPTSGNLSLTWGNQNNTSSGTTPPDVSQIFYDTDDNTIWLYNSGVKSDQRSLPIAEVTMSNGTVTSIDQVFNGFGYIGSTVFALPGVEGLIPNGRNEDGSLNNIKFKTSSVIIKTYTGNLTNTLYCFFSGTNFDDSSQYVEGGKEPSYNSVRWFDTLNNRMYWKNSSGIISKQNLAFIGLEKLGSSKITSFNPNNTFQAIDRNDTDWASLSSKPSNNYVDLTLSASGSSYTAISNGWFSLWQKDSTTSVGKITIRRLRDRFGVGTENTITGYTNLILPVQKGEKVAVYYSGITSTDFQFRFIYDEGAK